MGIYIVLHIKHFVKRNVITQYLGNKKIVS